MEMFVPRRSFVVSGPCDAQIPARDWRIHHIEISDVSFYVTRVMQDLRPMGRKYKYFNIL